MSGAGRAQIVSSWAGFSGSSDDDRQVLVMVARRCMSLWFWWVLANVGGGTLGLILWWKFAGPYGTVGAAMVASLPLSTAQSFVARRHLHQGRWVVATAVALPIGYHIWSFMSFGGGIPAAIAAIGPTEGFDVLGVRVDPEQFWQQVLGLFAIWGVVGVAQWWVLRRDMEYTGFWVLGSALGGAASGVAAVVALAASDQLLLSWLVRWSVYGALTGLVMVLLIQSRIRRQLHRRRDQARRTALMLDDQTR